MDLTERDILQKSLEWHASGRRVAVCTVVETWGSAPKPVGSHLVVDGDGAFIGSVSGGCVEGDVIVEAMEVLETGASRLLDFGVSDEKAWGAGLTCGGRIRVLVERLDEGLASCLTRLTGDDAASRPAVLVTALDGGPRRVIGPGDVPAHPLAAEIGDALRTGKSKLVGHDQGDHFLTRLTPATRLVVVGAVHIAQALSTIAKLAGLDMTVIDPRSAFATAQRFPDVRLIADWPVDAAEAVGLSEADAVAVLSHDPKIDDPALSLALAAGCFYVGALGSRRTHARRLERLRAAGVADLDLQRIRAPIGLDVGAEGPAEIAVSIAAEIISVRRSMSFGAVASAAA